MNLSFSSQVYEEVVLPESGEGSAMDSFVDVAEVEVGDGRSASPIKIDTGAAIAARLKASANAAAASTIAAANGTIVQPSAGGGEFHICRICNQVRDSAEVLSHLALAKYFSSNPAKCFHFP